MHSATQSESSYDVVVVGGGQGGFAAALTLGRARKRLLLSDAGCRQNAAAAHLHNFVTQDGKPPNEFRGIGREQLTTYPSVQMCDLPIETISGSRGRFQLTLSSGDVEARRDAPSLRRNGDSAFRQAGTGRAGTHGRRFLSTDRTRVPNGFWLVPAAAPGRRVEPFRCTFRDRPTREKCYPSALLVQE